MSLSTISRPHDVVESLTTWHQGLRAQFPIFDDAPGVAYLDSAATAQKPRSVWDAVSDYLGSHNANVGRSMHPWGSMSTARLLQAEATVNRFLGAEMGDVRWTSGASAAMHELAHQWYGPLLRDGDNVVVPAHDHGSTWRAWESLRDTLADRGVRIELRALPYEESFDYDYSGIEQLIDQRTRVVVATAVHHVFGNDMNLHRMRERIGAVPFIVDGTQAVGHVPIEVDRWGADHVTFSGHKALALTGVGVLWTAPTVSLRPSAPAWPGTPPICEIVSLDAALNWLMAADVATIHRWTSSLGALLTDALAQWDTYEVWGCQESLTLDSQVQRRASVVTFSHRELEGGDLAFMLAEEGIYVRGDHHCQGQHRGVTGARASFHAYTSPRDVTRLIEVLRRWA